MGEPSVLCGGGGGGIGDAEDVLVGGEGDLTGNGGGGGACLTR